MGLMDKAKEAALQAKASAEKVAHQGQAKVATIQQSRSEAELYRTLGEAFYKEQRRGGDREAVTAALEALDQHFASTAAASTGQPAAAPPPAHGTAPGQGTSPAQGTPPAAPPPGQPPAGDFRRDNL